MTSDGTQEFLLEAVLLSQSNSFSVLARVAGLDPLVDFQHSNLQNVDFSDSDLSEFDFSCSDLRGANWEGAIGLPHRFRHALRGHASIVLVGSDFKDLAATVFEGRTWAERFLSFATLVDGFGLVDETLEILERVVGGDSSDYMRACSYAYYCAVGVMNNEAMLYIRSMALQGNSYGNMYRIKRVRRYVSDFNKYLDRVEIKKNYPGAVASNEILKRYSAWQIGIE